MQVISKKVLAFCLLSWHLAAAASIAEEDEAKELEDLIDDDGKTFGIQITDQNNVLLAATTPFQTFALASIGALIFGASVAIGYGLGRSLFPGALGDLKPFAEEAASASGYGSFNYERQLVKRRAGRERRSADPEVESSEIYEEVMGLMGKSDPSDCYRRLICDLATGSGDVFLTRQMLNLVDGEDFGLSKKAQDFKYQLKIAYKIGYKTKDVDFCEEVFSCPVKGKELDQLITSQVKKQEPLFYVEEK